MLSDFSQTFSVAVFDVVPSQKHYYYYFVALLETLKTLHLDLRRLRLAWQNHGRRIEEQDQVQSKKLEVFLRPEGIQIVP